MINFELRILRGLSDTLQYRTKDVHVDSSTIRPVDMGWSAWKDVPIVEDK